MTRRIPIEVWQCPVCEVVQGVNGKPFLSSRSIALHIVGKAKNRDSAHRDRIVYWIPFVDFATWTNNEIAEQIIEFVEETEPEEEVIEETSIAAELPLEQYRIIREIEIGLHSFIRRRLQEHYGPREHEWWAEGVPLPVRMECVKRRESDTRRQDPFLYTDLIDLQTTLDKNWRMFEEDLKSTKDFFEANTNSM